MERERGRLEDVSARIAAKTSVDEKMAAQASAKLRGANMQTRRQPTCDAHKVAAAFQNAR